MISRRAALLSVLVLGGLAGSGMPAWAQRRANPVAQARHRERRHHGRAKKAAGALFDRLDRDRDGTFDRRELRGRVDAKEFAAADPDKEGTLTKDEYFTIVEKRFKAVDPDNDGTVSAAKLRTKAGRALLRLLVF